jgi:hypothetical protein
MENKYITEMSKEELILPVTEEEITAMFCHSHLCPEYVQGLFYDFSESTCEIVPCCLIVPPLYLLFRIASIN